MRIGVLTSGGDAPGMNAALRAVVRQAANYGAEVIGISYGFEGLLANRMQLLTPRAVGDIVHRGGTILRTARSDRFPTPAGLRQAGSNLATARIDGLVIIGGDGSMRGALALHAAGVRTVAVPATIDNDVPGTERSIGFDTAVNTAVEAISRIRDTASAHERTFVVEVMGRSSGAIALAAGLAGGAELVLIPELPVDYDDVAQKLEASYNRGKRHSIIVVAEGAAAGFDVARAVRERTGMDTRVTILGHIQRGGTPTAADRILGGRLGAGAVDALLAGNGGRLVGVISDRVEQHDLETVLKAPGQSLPVRELAELTMRLAI